MGIFFFSSFLSLAVLQNAKVLRFAVRFGIKIKIDLIRNRNFCRYPYKNRFRSTKMKIDFQSEWVVLQVSLITLPLGAPLHNVLKASDRCPASAGPLDLRENAFPLGERVRSEVGVVLVSGRARLVVIACTPYCRDLTSFRKSCTLDKCANVVLRT